MSENTEETKSDSPDADSPEVTRIKEDIVKQLHTVFDPEIPVDIYELGLIYNIDVSEAGAAEIQMTLTSPNCPAAESLPAEVDQKVLAVDGVTESNVHIVWEPTWSPDLMSEEAKLELNMF